MAIDYQFRLQHGTIYLFDGEQMITGYHRLAFGVDVSVPDGCVLLKWGRRSASRSGTA
jgi:hypothetical protein